MSKELLLIKRWKVIAPWPGMEESNLKVGSMLLKSRDDRPQDFHMMTGYIAEKFAKRYPNLFHELHWSEDRKLEEMPEYVLHLNKVWKVHEWLSISEGKWLPVADKNYYLSQSWRQYYMFSLPATEEEYLKQNECATIVTEP